MVNKVFSIIAAAIFLQLSYPIIALPSGAPKQLHNSSFALPIRVEIGGKLVHKGIKPRNHINGGSITPKSAENKSLLLAVM